MMNEAGPAKMASDRRLSWRIRALPGKIFHLLGDNSLGGGPGPPNAFQHSRRYPSRMHGSSTSQEWFALYFGNDAWDVQIATKYTDEDESRWRLFMAAEDFRKLALWYLWRWAWGEWFGLRRWLYYAWLERRCRRYKRE